MVLVQKFDNDSLQISACDTVKRVVEAAGNHRLRTIVSLHKTEIYTDEDRSKIHSVAFVVRRILEPLNPIGVLEQHWQGSSSAESVLSLGQAATLSVVLSKYHESTADDIDKLVTANSDAEAPDRATLLDRATLGSSALLLAVEIDGVLGEIRPSLRAM